MIFEPHTNAHCERVIKTIRHECLDCLLIFGERHLRSVLREYIEHYHGERNHQGISNRLIDSSGDELRRSGSIERRERLGGLLRYYHRAA